MISNNLGEIFVGICFTILIIAPIIGLWSYGSTETYNTNNKGPRCMGCGGYIKDCDGCDGVC